MDHLMVTSESETLIEIRGLLETLIREVRELRRERLPADPGKIGELVTAIYGVFEDSTWAVVDLMEATLDDQSLLKEITKSLGGKTSIKKLSRFLRKSIGIHNTFTLHLVNEHGREGALFMVTKVT